MSTTPVTAEDLYLFAMHLLSDEEDQRIRDFLPRSPEARRELGNVRGDLALLAFGSEPREVPASARQRLLQGISREPRKTLATEGAAVALPRVNGAIRAASATAVIQDAALGSDTYTPSGTYTPSTGATETPLPMRLGVQDEQPRRSFFSLLMPWAGWAVAAGMAVSTWTYYERSTALVDRVAFANASAARATATSARATAVLETLRSASAQRFVLTAATVKPVPEARVTYLAATGGLVFQGSNMEPAPTDRTYELWLIPAGEGAKPIPAGTFKPDARGFASVILPDMPKGMVAAAFGVTMENEGGAGTPTLPILMTGTA